MYELIQAGPSSYYINCPAKIGIYARENGEAYLIDSGNDKDAGKKALKHLEQMGLRLQAVINTHSNADHIGGNHFLQQKTGCKVFAGGIEGAFTQSPVLEPSFLYGGYPCQDLRHKFLMAQPSDVTPFTDGSFPAELELIPLPGHFFDMVGVRTPDQTVFLADCVSSPETLAKYKLSFIYDVQSYLNTLDRIQEMQAALFVPAHAEASGDIKELACLNRQTVYEIADRIAAFCETPLCSEEILQKVFTHYGLTMNFEQYVLIGSTVRSYLSWLKDSGKIDAYFENNRLLWKKKSEVG